MGKAFFIFSIYIYIYIYIVYYVLRTYQGCHESHVRWQKNYENYKPRAGYSIVDWP